jgi:hypothetical protein
MRFDMKNKLIVTGAVLLSLISATATAAKLHQKWQSSRHRVTIDAVDPSWQDPPCFRRIGGQPRYSGVACVAGTTAGTDPDPHIRAGLMREFSTIGPQ